MDVMVLRTQQWLNRTYSGRTGYVEVNETGNTGYSTIYALTRALQIELGITATSSNFGPTTTAKFNQRFPNGVSQQADNDETEDNIYGIIQGALWCKGYSTGASDITKHFFGGTGRGIKNMKEDAGMVNPNSTVTIEIMKALLSMKQYKLVYGGDSTIRTIQQTLNRKYSDYIVYEPCDGVFGREMCEALIIVLQAIEGFSVSEATGNFGNGTKSRLPVIPYTGSTYTDNEIEEAILLVRYALYCNGYNVDVTSSAYNTELIEKLQEFQSDMIITSNGIVNLDTWMALLLSKGNPDRACIACDTRFEMTDERIAYLKNNGYQVVGRYLTGGDFKELRITEPQRILDAGLKFFPIFQESGTNLDYFTTERGALDAKSAYWAAKKFKIPAGSIIYFAVDTDPTDPEIETYILPYFQSVKRSMGNGYQIGVYGTRNVCMQVMEEGYAVTCFVSDMSTGYSGNMGFKMPENWNLDQFHEFVVTTASGSWDLDKVAYSNKFPVVSSLATEEESTGKACTTTYELTVDRITYLKNNGYQVVGRYLTGGNRKQLRPNEANRIINAGLKLFPIFQEHENNLAYFTTNNGELDAMSAIHAALKHGIKNGNVIYFSVPFTANNTAILNYFSSLKTKMATKGNLYKIGIYGPRSICKEVIDAGYAETCFINDISIDFDATIWDIPANVNLVEFRTVEVQTLNGAWTLNDMIYYGNYLVVDELENPSFGGHATIREGIDSYYLGTVKNLSVPNYGDVQMRYGQYFTVKADNFQLKTKPKRNMELDRIYCVVTATYQYGEDLALNYNRFVNSQYETDDERVIDTYYNVANGTDYRVAYNLTEAIGMIDLPEGFTIDLEIYISTNIETGE